MLAAERHQQILERLRRDGKVVAAELSTALAVSADTVRRDLRDLAQAELLRRVHGGALPPTPGLGTYPERLRREPQAKADIARAVTRLLKPGQVIVLDGGTTTTQVAHELPRDLRASVITNSPPIAAALATHPYVDVSIVGGRLQKDGLVTVGAAAVDALRSVRPDVCILGVCSVHPEIGITTVDAEEALVKRTMIETSAEVVAVAVADKLGTVSPYVVAPIGELTHLVTDAVDDEAVAPYEAAGITVIRA